MANTFVLTAGVDNYTGLAGDDNIFELDPTTLQSTDTVTGGAAGAFHDFLVVTAGGTITASQFAGVTNMEELNLAAAGNTVTLANGLVAGNSIGYFAVLDGGGDDTVDASGITNSTAIAFFINGGTDSFTGGNGNDAFIFTGGAQLSAATTLVGGTGNDTIYLGTGGTLTAADFANVSGVEGLVLAGAGNAVTLNNALVAGSSLGFFGVSGGGGTDTVDASGVNNNIGVAFFAASANETFKGGNGPNAFVFAPAQLAATATVQGGSGVDNLYLSAAGTVAAGAFANVTGIEGLVLANGTNNVTLTNGLIAGTSIGYFAVAGGSGNDTVDASGVTNNVAIAFYGTTGGNDTFTGGNGNDSFLFAAGTLTSADTVTGGGGNDTLWMTTAGTVNTGDLAGVSGIEGVFQQAGGTFHFANGITGAASVAAVGSSAVDTFDGSAVTGYALMITGNGGADVLSGGSQNDKFFIADSAFASIDGNAGTDFIVLTQASQTLDLTGTTTVSDIEVVDLTQAATATLTLTSADVSQITGGGNNLYVVADANDIVNIGSGWTFVSGGNTNAAIAGHTFVKFNNGTANLFVDVAVANEQPDLTPNSPGAASYIENAAATALLSTGAVADPDNPADFTGGSFTVAITGNASTGDQIVLLGSAPFAVNGSSLLFAGKVVGTITGLGSSSASVTALTSVATPTVVNQLVKAFGYQNSNDDPATLARTVTFTFNDGGNSGVGGAISDTVTQTVNVTAVNDAPVNTVPTTLFSATLNGTVAITGLSVSDIDSQGASETVTLGVTHGTMSASGGTAVVTNNNTATVTLTGTIAQINATLAAGNIVYHPTSGYTGSDTLTVTANDGGHSPSGAQLDIDTVSLFVNGSTSLTGQLWYTILDVPGPGPGAPPGTLPRQVGGYINSDGNFIEQAGPSLSGTSTPPITAYTIAVDTAAGYFFVGNSDHLSISSYRISDNTLVSTVVIGNDFGTPSGFDDELVNTVAVDPINHILFANRWDSDTAHTGIVKVSYNATTGVLDPTAAFGSSPSFLVTGTSTSGNYTMGTTFEIDIATHKLYYTDWDNKYNIAPFSPTNAIYVVSDYTAASPTVTKLTSQVQFPTDASNGFIGNIAVDDAKGLLYFTTLDYVSPGAGHIWYMPIAGGTATKIMDLDNLNLGDGDSSGLSLDPVTQQLYVSTAYFVDSATANANKVLVYQLSADGHSFVGGVPVASYTLTQLEGQAPTDTGSHPGGSVFEQLPTLTVSSSRSFTEGSAATLDNALTVGDADGGYFKGATVTTFGGFSGDGDTLTFSTAGTSITGNLVSSNGNLTLTFSGYDTIANYQAVLRTVAFNSGDNPTNFNGTNSTRTVHWFVDDGAPNIPFGAQNSGSTTINITATNDAPTLDLDANNSSGATGSNYQANYLATGPFVAIADVDASAADLDNLTLASATVTLTDAKAGDVLAVTGALPAGITAVITPGAGTITVALSGAASAASYAAALQHVVFANSSASPDLTDRVFNVVINDGAASSTTATTTIHVATALLAAPGGVASSSNAPGENHLTLAGLNSVVQSAIDHWAAAGATADQIALLNGTTFAVADLADNTLAETSGNLILFDPSAAGYGWFVDPTPQDNAEYRYTANAAGTDLFTDPATDAAGHMDLLTAVMHEMGHVLGLPDLTVSGGGVDLMDNALVTGERRLPSTADVVMADLIAAGAAQSASTSDTTDVPTPVHMFDPGPQPEGVLGPVRMFDPGPQSEMLGPVRMFDPGPLSDAQADEVPTPVRMFDPGPLSDAQASDVPTPVRMFDPGPQADSAPPPEALLEWSAPLGSSLFPAPVGNVNSNDHRV